jgi:hypothetical protein
MNKNISVSKALAKATAELVPYDDDRPPVYRVYVAEPVEFGIDIHADNEKDAIAKTIEHFNSVPSVMLPEGVVADKS